MISCVSSMGFPLVEIILVMATILLFWLQIIFCELCSLVYGSGDSLFSSESIHQKWQSNYYKYQIKGFKMTLFCSLTVNFLGFAALVDRQNLEG
jgi:hypothetical protein